MEFLGEEISGNVIWTFRKWKFTILQNEMVLYTHKLIIIIIETIIKIAFFHLSVWLIAHCQCSRWLEVLSETSVRFLAARSSDRKVALGRKSQSFAVYNWWIFKRTWRFNPTLIRTYWTASFDHFGVLVKAISWVEMCPKWGKNSFINGANANFTIWDTLATPNPGRQNRENFGRKNGDNFGSNLGTKYVWTSSRTWLQWMPWRSFATCACGPAPGYQWANRNFLSNRSIFSHSTFRLSLAFKQYARGKS